MFTFSVFAGVGAGPFSRVRSCPCSSHCFLVACTNSPPSTCIVQFYLCEFIIDFNTSRMP